MTPRLTPLRLFVIVTAVFGSLAIYFVPRMDASGDEPHYLVMAQSLGREHDLDLRDNYGREDWKEYRGGPTDPHYAAPRKDGRPFPGHAPGLPFLLAPIYAVGGRLACVLLLSAMVAGSGALAFWIATREGLSASAALLAGLLAAGPPLAAFSLHVYTEAPSALALFGAYSLLRFSRREWAAGASAGIACALPFLHPRMAAGSLAIAFAAFLFRDRVSFPVFAFVAALGAAGYGLFWMSIFGSPSALGIYGGLPEDAALNPARALMGLLMDRAYGILPVAPAFLALLLLKRPASKDAEEARFRQVEVVMIMAVLLPVLFWRMWWGGQSPPARLVAPMTPFLALWLVRLWDGLAHPRARWAIAGATLWSWAIFLFAALQPGRLLFINKRARPTRVWEALWPGGPIDALLPDLARPESSDWLIAAAWLTLLLGSVFVVRRAGGKAPARVP
jgi:hypothetical protein